MEKLEQLYEGKAKKVFKTNEDDKVIVSYKDDATAFNGEKKGQIKDKGIINNVMSNLLFKLLEEKGIKTHFIEELNERETLVKKVKIVPLEVIVRNVSAGSFSKRYGVEEGILFKQPSTEFSYKVDELGDPLINDEAVIALEIATREEIDLIKDYALKINEVLKEFFIEKNLKVIDFKLEFGKTMDGEIVLADEISPDTMRLWDKDTNEKMDKDRFRRDLGNLEETYKEVLRRIKS